MKVGHINTQGWGKKANKLYHAKQLMKRRRLGILFLSEVRVSEASEYRSEHFLVVLQGDPDHQGSGVGVIIAPDWVPFIQHIKQHSPRLIEVAIRSAQGDTRFFGTYMPPNTPDHDETRHKAWDHLSDILNSLPSHTFYHVLGDLNTRITHITQEEENSIGPNVLNLADPTPSQQLLVGNRAHLRDLLVTHSLQLSNTFLATSTVSQATYAEKGTLTRARRNADPLHFHTAIQAHEVLRTNVDKIRSFLNAAEPSRLEPFLPRRPQHSIDKHIHRNPAGFQTLDYTITPTSWRAAILSSKAIPCEYFPSDHFLVESTVRIKLGKKHLHTANRKKLVFYVEDEEQMIELAGKFNDCVRESIAKQSNHTAAPPLSPLVEAPPPHRQDNNYDSSAPHRFAYTDGGGPARGRNTAGWGWCYIDTKDTPEGKEDFEDPSKPYNGWQKGCGPVISSDRNIYYLGATKSTNNTGEATAMAELFIALIEHDITGAITLHYDSKWAANMTRGIWKPSHNRQLIKHTKLLYKMAQKRIRFQWKWVKGHQNNKGNTYADQLATRGRGLENAQGGRYDNHSTTFTNVTQSNPDQPDPATPSLPSASTEILTAAIVSATNNTFAQRPQIPNKPWISDNTLSLLTKEREAAQVGNFQASKYFKKQARKTAQQDRIRWLHDKLDNDRDQHYPHHINKNLWDTIRGQRKGFTPSRNSLKWQGQVQPNQNRNKVMAKHLQEVQWVDSRTHPEKQTQQDYHTAKAPMFSVTQDINTSPISIDELELIIARLRKGKAPGRDELRPEAIMLLDDENKDTLLRTLNEVWSQKQIPESWRTANVVSIFKKGDSTDPANYRPISLLAILYKIYTGILQRRISKAIDQRIRSTQYGFRKYKSTLQPIHIIRRAQELREAGDDPLYLLFLDWKMAFDRVDHTALIESLRRIGLPQIYLEIIGDIYSGSNFFTIGGQGEEGEGTSATGIRQGCPLSPYLFDIVMTCVMFDAEEIISSSHCPRNVWSVTRELFDLEYADDTVLLAVSKQQMQIYFSAIQEISPKYGLFLNQKKTVLMSQYTDNTTPLLFSDATPVREVRTDAQGKPHCTTYLGVQISSDSSSRLDLKSRLSRASQKYKQMKHIWNSNLTPQQKLRVFQSIFLPLITYALPQSVLLDSDLQHLDSWYIAKVRNLFKIKHSFYSRVSHRTAFEQAGKPLMPSIFTLQQQLKFLQTLLTSPQHDPVFHVCLNSAYNDRISMVPKRRGRPRTRFLQTLILRTAKVINTLPPFPNFPIPFPPDILYIKRLTQDQWKKVVAVPTRTPTPFLSFLSFVTDGEAQG